jgi:uncharacterized protein YycO
VITLQFSTERGLASWAIRWGTWCDISHVDLLLPKGYLLGARSDTVNPGVQIRMGDYGDFTRIIQCDYHFSPAQTKLYVDWCFSQIGKPYDTRGIASYFTHKRRNRDWRDESAWYCSEYHARASEVAENPFLDFSHIGIFKIDPRDLLLVKPLARRYIL